MNIRDAISTIQAIVTTIAVIIGGIWTYLLFIEHREIAPRVNISHKIQSADITENITWLHIESRINNIGKTRVTLSNGQVRLQLIKPLADSIQKKIDLGKSIFDSPNNIVLWPLIKKRQFDREIILEPGEVDIIPIEFIVPKEFPNGPR